MVCLSYNKSLTTNKDKKVKGVAIAMILPEKKIVYYYDLDENKFKEPEKCFRKLILEDDDKKIHAIPYKPPEGVQRVAPMIFGLSGSGKSLYLARLINRYDHILPKKKIKGKEVETNIYLLTANQSDEIDPAYEESGLDVKKIDISWAMNNLTIDMLSNSFVIFDDFWFYNKQYDTFMQSLLNNLLERSRKMHISIFMILHDARNGKQTKLPLLESTSFTGFIRSNTNAVLKLFDNYADFNREQLNYIKKLNGNGRFTTITYNKNPSYLISEDRIIFLDDI